MKYLVILIGLLLICPALSAQSISKKQKVQLEKLQKVYSDRFQKALSPQDLKVIDRFGKEADSLGKIRSERQKTLAIQALNKKYSKFRSEVMSKARMSDELYMREVGKILPKHQFKKSSKGIFAINRRALTLPSTSSVNTDKFKLITSPKKVSKSSTDNIEDVVPITFTRVPEQYEFSTCGSFSDWNSGFTGDDGFMSSAGGMFVSGCESILALGANVEVPEGVRTVRVRITLDRGFFLEAFSEGLLGYGHAHTELGIRVKGPGLDEYFTDTELISIAPVLFISELELDEDGTYIMEASFTPWSYGGTYRVQAYGKSFGMGAVFGAGSSKTFVPEVSKVEAFFE